MLQEIIAGMWVKLTRNSSHRVAIKVAKKVLLGSKRANRKTVCLGAGETSWDNGVTHREAEVGAPPAPVPSLGSCQVERWAGSISSIIKCERKARFEVEKQ